MPGFAHSSVLISLVAFLFALLLVATPPLAVLTVPKSAPFSAPFSTPVNTPVEAPRAVSFGSAFA